MKNSPFVTIGVIACTVVLACVILLLNAVAIPGSVTAADPGNCKISDIQGSINGGTATVKNVSDHPCTVGLAVFKLLPGPFSLDNQELFRNDQRDFNPGKTITLSVELPSCDYQIDLYAGNFPGSAHFSSDHLIDANIVTGRCGNPPQLPAATTLTAQCVGGTTPRIVLNWNPVANQATNGLIKNINGADGFFVQPGPSMTQFSYTDTNVSFGNTYSYRIKTHPNVSSNMVSITPSVASCGGAGVTPTPTPTIPAMTLLVTPGSIVCAPNTSTQTVLNWASVSGVSSYTVKVRAGTSGSFSVLASGVTTTSLSTPATAGQWSYQVTAVNAQGNEFVASNIVTINIATPQCATPTPTAGPTPLSCSPSTQLVGSGGAASLVANGGTGLYFWNAPGGDPSQGFFQNFTTRYTSSVDAINQVTVRSGSETVTCVVRVQASTTPTPTPTPGVMSIQKTGRNITQGQTAETTTVTVRGNDTVEFLIRIRSLASSTLTNVIVQDALPQGVNYIPNTTSVNNVQVQDGLTGGGINIGSLSQNQEALIRFSALVAPGTTFPNGSLSAVNTAYGRADNVQTIQSQASLTRSSIGTVAGVETGPGETLLITLLVSGVLTYGYMLYTGTALFNRRDALAKVRQHGGNPDTLNFMRFLR